MLRGTVWWPIKFLISEWVGYPLGCSIYELANHWLELGNESAKAKTS